MCDHESFARLRDQTEENSKQIAALAQSDAVQSEQIKTLKATTEQQGANQTKILDRMLWLFAIILLLTVLALIFGGLGEQGFNAITKAAPTMISTSGTPEG